MKIRPFQSQTCFSCFLGIFMIYRKFLDKIGHVQKTCEYLGYLVEYLGYLVEYLGYFVEYLGYFVEYLGQNM
jgi:hypothetical protein